MYRLSLTEHRPEITSKVPMWEGSSKYFLLEKESVKVGNLPVKSCIYSSVVQLVRAPVSETGGWKFKSFHCYIYIWVCNSVWLEYLSDTQEVGGSSPSAPTNAPIYANWSGSHPLKVEIWVRVSLGVQKYFKFICIIKIFLLYLYCKFIYYIENPRWVLS